MDVENGRRRALRGPHREVDLGVDRLQDNGIDHAPAHRSGPEGGDGAGRHATQAAAHHPLHAAGQDALRQWAPTDPLQPPAVFCQCADDLDEEEGDALRLARQQREHLRSENMTADHRRAERLDLRGAEPPQSEQRQAAHLALEVRRLVVATAPQQDEPQCRCDTRQPLEEAEALAACPLQILENHQHPATLRAEELLHDEQETGLCGFGGERRRLGGVAREELLDVGDDSTQDGHVLVAQAHA